MAKKSKNSQHIFITGIGTEVGKTIISAIVTEALQADYFKPIQAGDLDYADMDKVQSLISNDKSKFHKNSFALNTPMSPHAAADIDGVKIEAKSVKIPNTKNTLVIEGAGGLLVPINDTETILDLIPKDAKVVLVSRHYLGSINHTLLSVKILQDRGIEPVIIFNGKEHPTTEAIIRKMAGCQIIGRVDEEPYFDQRVVAEYADLFKESLEALL
ncbi:dethiobiotin synthase [Aquimarina brevivitae]|uniref:ATP-dependent dethiobiotin synthetase BioD n=1 Tax=Aquimarina brevivitae TaxID=323412 RepID=A0A4Q7PGF0_9FLAO|nr:dethiobiotin synthase [Aquimarina brevivitae]RZS99571.1 dethiobiotin synthetase [Aquimarina brevivitae]